MSSFTSGSGFILPDGFAITEPGDKVARALGLPAMAYGTNLEYFDEYTKSWVGVKDSRVDPWHESQSPNSFPPPETRTHATTLGSLIQLSEYLIWATFRVGPGFVSHISYSQNSGDQPFLHSQHGWCERSINMRSLPRPQIFGVQGMGIQFLLGCKDSWDHFAARYTLMLTLGQRAYITAPFSICHISGEQPRGYLLPVPLLVHFQTSWGLTVITGDGADKYMPRSFEFRIVLSGPTLQGMC